MHSNKAKAVAGLLFWAVGLLLAGSNIVTAERLPVRAYTTADGLAQNAVNRIVRDSRGFLWFCTEDGLSRYDGYTFTNYGADQGLPDTEIRDLLETRDGQYWIATSGGICRFDPKGRPWPRAHNTQQEPPNNPMFVPYSPNDHTSMGGANVLLEDPAGVVWCGAGQGLYRLEQANGEWTLRVVEIGLPRVVENDTRVRALAEDRQGTLWIGAGSGLYRRWADGRTERYTTAQGLPGNEVRALALDADEQLWAGTREGLSQIELEPATRQPRVLRVYNAKSGLIGTNTRALFQASGGQLWVGLSTALVGFIPEACADGSFSHHYVSEVKLSGLFVQALAEDRAGNLWIGTDNGALKLARNGFTTYTEADGLGESRVSSLFESRAGVLCGMTLFSSVSPLSWFDGNRFRAIRPRLPQHLTYFGWGWHQLTLQDRAGEWWLPTGQGLVRYPKINHVEQLASTAPKAIYTTREGLASNDVFRLYEDGRGDIWIATFSEAGGGISRWERATQTFHHYGEAAGLPVKTPTPQAFAQDRAGTLWIGFDTAALARFGDGRFTLFTPEQGLPAGKISDLYLDQAGRLWIASTQGGLARLDPASAQAPQFIIYTTAQGLSSNNVNCITEDRYGRLYVGTARGLDRLDPESGHVKGFAAADGLISGEVLVSFRDRKGDLWFGGKSGLSRLSPQADPPESPPPVLLTGLRIGGVPHQISALGETEIAALELGPNQNHIELDFVALGFGQGEGLRYQYYLEGGSENWSQLADQRRVNFANLAPGRYRFHVRATNADGLMSEPAASFSFRILPPIWQRWWFVALVAALSGLLAYALYRYRVNQLLKVERVRTRIASDLHDDIGSSLSQISIISEVVRTQLSHENSSFAAPLSTIAQTSRELVDTMSDIVWAINPRRDNLYDLVSRMRHFAMDTLTAQEKDFNFNAPDSLPETKVETDTRREVFLIFKEALNNACRHSRGTLVQIDLGFDSNALQLAVTDDGVGFDPGQDRRGHGLTSMRQRAERIGGHLEIHSTPGRGTKLNLRAPLKAQRRRRSYTAHLNR